MALTQPGPGRSMDSGVNEDDPSDEDVSRDQTIAVESRDADKMRLSVGHTTARTYATD
jgi:hypothetical protein